MFLDPTPVSGEGDVKEDEKVLLDVAWWRHLEKEHCGGKTEKTEGDETTEDDEEMRKPMPSKKGASRA